MDQDRILDKIKKCLEMAKSKTANPNEAEIALRQARALMDKYSLEMGDVLASMAGEHQVMAGSEGEPPAWRVRLAQVCAQAFGCKVIISSSLLTAPRFTYIGCAAAPELSGYAYQVLERQLQKARRDYVATQKRCKLSTRRARGDAFANSWIDAVHAKVQDFAGADDSVVEAIEAYTSKRYPNLQTAELKRRKLSARDHSAAEAGYRAGKSAQLHHGIGADQRPMLTAGV